MALRGATPRAAGATKHPLRWTEALGLAAITTMLVLGGVLAMPSSSSAAEPAVVLGTAGTYSVLGGQTVTSTGATALSSDLGVSPGTAITGFPPGTVAGATHAGDPVAAQAQADLQAAYVDAVSRTPTATISGDLIGQTLLPGVYNATSSIALSGTLTLDGGNNLDSVFIFQVGSTLTTAAASHVVLVNGAQACNVFWQIGSSATLGAASSLRGTIMAAASITVGAGTLVEGGALARDGSVTLDSDMFTTPPCEAEPPPTTTTTEPPTTTTTEPPTTTTTEPPTTTTTEPPTTTTTEPPTTTTTEDLAAQPDGSTTAPGAADGSPPTDGTVTPVAGLDAGGRLPATGGHPLLSLLCFLGAGLLVSGSVIVAAGRPRVA